MARLSWSHSGTSHDAALDGSLTVVGSDPSAALHLGGADVSPVHCEIRRGPEGWRVVDMESRAGTKVNGEFVNTKALRDGDVIDVGGIELVFHGDAPAQAATPQPAAAARPAAARPAAPVRGAAPVRRGAAAPSRGALDDLAASGGDADEDAQDAADARRGARLARKAAQASNSMYIIAGVVGAILVGWLLFGVVFGGSHNGKVRGAMAAAERSQQWQRMLDLSRDAIDDGSYEYQQIQIAADRARQYLAGEATGERVEQSNKDWATLRYWRQEHWKDDEEYVRRIDEFLTAFPGLESEGVKQARMERTKVAGTSAVGGQSGTGEAAWTVLLNDTKALENDGRFGDAVAKVDAWWTANQSTAPTMLPRVNAEKERLVASAEKWFQKQVALGAHYFSNGERKKAQRTIEAAGQKIGLPGYEKRAAEEVDRVLR